MSAYRRCSTAANSASSETAETSIVQRDQNYSGWMLAASLLA